MKTQIAVFAFVASIMAASPASALAGAFEATSIEATEVQRLAGFPRAMELTRTAVENEARPFTIEAAAGRIEVEYMGRTLSGSAGVDRASWSEVIIEGPFAVRGLGISSGFSAWIWSPPGSQGGLEVAAHGVAVRVHDESQVEQKSFMAVPGGREMALVDVSGSARVSLSGSGNITVGAPFTVAFWNNEVAYRAPGQQERVLWSGSEDGSLHPEDAPTVRHDGAQQVYVTVEEGNLTFPLLGDLEFLYADVDDAVVQKSATLRNATVLESSTARTDISADGPHRIAFRDVTSDSLVVDIVAVAANPAVGDGSGPLASGEPMDGDTETSSVAPGSPANPPAATALPWIVGAALSAALAAVVFAARLRGQRIMEAARDAMEFGVYDVVVAKTRSLLASRRHGREAAIMHVVATLADEGGDAAAARLERLQRRAHMDGAIGSYLDACIKAHLGLDEQAKASLAQALEMDESLMMEASRNPRLAPLLGVTRRAAVGHDDQAYT